MQTAPSAATVTNVGFENVEEMQGHFSRVTGVVAPLLTTGGVTFLKEFASWFVAYQYVNNSVDVYLPPDPAHAIAFPTGGEFLQCTISAAKQLGDRTTLDDLLDKYSLSKELCDQPTYTLSGGERALVALAKSWVLVPYAERVVLANPARWLYPNRRHLIGEVLCRVKPNIRQAEFLYLYGEPASPYVSDDFPRKFTLEHPWWQLNVDRPEILFPPPSSNGHTEGKRLVYDLEKHTIDLNSPTLLTGDNGVGKSTFAKLMCGVLQQESGWASATARGFRNATCRLLFQDIPEQLFALSPRDHLNRVFEFDSKLRGQAWELFERLQNRLRELTGGSASKLILGTDSDPSSLLQAKMLLAAERLVSPAGVLICDEPTWGLSRAAGAAFVLALCEEAGKRGIVLIIISHDTNLSPDLFGSRLHFSRRDRNGVVSMQAREPSESVS